MAVKILHKKVQVLIKTSLKMHFKISEYKTYKYLSKAEVMNFDFRN